MTEYPPSTGIAVPVTKSRRRAGEEHRDARQIVGRAPASGRRAAPARARAGPDLARARRWSGRCRSSPAARALTWMLSLRPRAPRSERQLHDAALARTHRRRERSAPKIDIIEPMLMILPPPAAFMRG